MKPGTMLTNALAMLALAGALSFCAVPSALAAPRNCGGCGMIGLARGQVARVNAAHIGNRNQQSIEYEIVWIDAAGAVVARDSQTIAPGQAVFFDLSFEAIGGAGDRIELRPVISGGPEPHLRMSLEVYDAETGKTTVFIGDAGD